MLDREQALNAAINFLTESRWSGEPELQVDLSGVRERHGFLVVPYNSTAYIQNRDEMERLLDCWPIIVDMSTGECRFSELEERMHWR